MTKRKIFIYYILPLLILIGGISHSHARGALDVADPNEFTTIRSNASPLEVHYQGDIFRPRPVRQGSFGIRGFRGGGLRGGK